MDDQLVDQTLSEKIPLSNGPDGSDVNGVREILDIPRTSTTLSLVTRTRSIASDNEKRLLGDFSEPEDQTPISVPTNAPAKVRMSVIQATFKPRNTLISEPNDGRQYNHLPKHTYGGKTFSRKPGNPRHITGNNAQRPEKVFNLHAEDEEGPPYKRVKKDDAIELSSDDGGSSVRMVSSKDTTSQRPSPPATARTGKRGLAGQRAGLSGSVHEYKDVEHTMKGPRKRAPALFSATKGNQKNTQSPSDSIIEIGPVPVAFNAPPEYQPRTGLSGNNARKMSGPSEKPYAGTANFRKSRRQVMEEDLRTAQNGRRHEGELETQSPYFTIPGKSMRASVESRNSVAARAESKTCQPEDRSVLQLSRQNSDTLPQSSLVENARSRKTGVTVHAHRSPTPTATPVQAIELVDNPLILVGEDSVTASKRQAKLVDGMRMEPNVQGSVSTVLDIRRTEFIRGKKRDVSTSVSQKVPKASHGFCNPWFRVKALDIMSGDQHFQRRVDSSVSSPESHIFNDEFSKSIKLSQKPHASQPDQIEVITPLEHVFKVDCSPETSLVILSTRQKSGRQGWIWIKFSSNDDSIQFRSDLLESQGQIRFQRRNADWMANHQHKTLLEAHNRPTPISPTRDQDRVTVMIHQSEERKKASDEYVELEISTVPRSPRQGRHLDRDLYSPPLHDPPTTVTVTKTPHSGPRKQVTTSRNQYNTRSRGRQSDKETSGSENISIIAQSTNAKVQKYSKSVGSPKEWTRPLVYPAEGPRKTTVDWIDLGRLDEGEFLNDNLIAFYLRFLEQNMENSEPTTAQRVHIFNTFFYERLTSAGQGHKGINFEAISKWTSKIDIFEFDYVVVPINESAHWYLAIICNLPKLVNSCSAKNDDMTSIGSVRTIQSDGPIDGEKRPSGADSAIAVRDGVGDAMDVDPVVQKAREAVAQLSLSPMDVDGPASPVVTVVHPDSGLNEGGKGVLDEGVEEHSRNVSFAASHSADAELEPRVSPAAPKSPKTDLVSGKGLVGAAQAETKGLKNTLKMAIPPRQGKEKPSSGLRKYDVESPVIITLDSLGHPHSATVGNLKQYLVQEGLARRQLTIDPKSISGITAKQIPLQDNFCDCGLFLLGYMEKFLHNPRLLVHKLLQREMNEQEDWPAMRPTAMRNAIRDILIKLSEDQEQAWKATKREEAKRKGKYHESKGSADGAKTQASAAESEPPSTATLPGPATTTGTDLLGSRDPTDKSPGEFSVPEHNHSAHHLDTSDDDDLSSADESVVAAADRHLKTTT